MPQFFSNKRLMFLLLSVIILVAMIGYSLRDDRTSSWPEKFISDTTGLFQNIFHTPAQFFAGFFENIDDLRNTYKENERLRSKLDEQTQYETEIQQLKIQNQELKDELGRKETLADFTTIPATLIARNPEMWYNRISINKGSNQGVEKNMAVITSKGLIGRVISVDNFKSTVQLLSDPDRRNLVAAQVVEKDSAKLVVHGLIRGYDREKKALMFEIEPDEKREIKKGDIVQTSGTGGVMPPNLPIGEVIDVQPDSYGLTKIAYVKPAADFYDIGNVTVVDRTADTADPNDLSSEEEGS
ncbi:MULTISPECIES: rod shape-determining protein MreC [Bacillus]|uniref:Cell shape-determining protein MreC n=2 Tax=Bacillus TaxID=1386 RepID=A0A0M4G957_9BACI|nr:MULTISPECIES: rod shape-determining protein MreC [Bacillus]ALC81853.1 rod shape-determining protein MreC [Bacillus gobiensis]MBP1083163.1 rod shape-determining protein MreC [Bacillus capparidis]MED1097604.1 rod shape-determining protein MreC [Bacillus capparidis]